MSITHINIPMSQYPTLLNGLRDCSEEIRKARLRNLARTDLYFLLRYLLNRPDIEHPWLFDRCREIQKNPNEYLDLWAREHYKSTIITYGKTIQDIFASHGDEPLHEREFTFGLFSFNAGTANKFVQQVKQELETNKVLIELFPDILYENPSREAQSWSVQGGLVVKRQSNPKEPTLAGHGLVDSMPTGSHYWGRLYDDVITERFARSPEMIQKCTESWELSLNLGARGGFSRYIGTRYHYNDPYRVMMKRGAAKPRIYTATEDNLVEGEPVLLTRDELAKKRREQGPYTFACQMMQNPKADETQGFKVEWLKYYKDHQNGAGMNIYILVDPANDKKKKSDYTSLWVIGLSQDKNYYALDFIRDRLNLAERTRLLFDMHKKWRPLGVGYERYGKDSDIAHIEDKMESENYRFTITEVAGKMAKNDRIKGLVPLFEQGRIYLPRTLHKTNYEKVTEDLVDIFIQEEYKAFPVPVHDDMLDSLARINDMQMTFPIENNRLAINFDSEF